MTELPKPPHPHSLCKITQDPDKPEIYWLERHHETKGPWTTWNWAQRPDGSRPSWVQEAHDPREDD